MKNILESLKSTSNGITTFSCLLLIAIGSLILKSCASVQSPTGGPKDSIAPKIIKETPPNLSRNFKVDEIRIEFDEFVKIANEFTEVSISPALDVMPTFKVKKDLITIKFSEPLAANTTYTINFGKAISDVNESNPLTNYTYVFSTGNEIDSLSISGTVISALTKERLKDVTVFILPTSQDSLFGKKKANIFNTTDSSGNFRLQNLREDSYRIYALKESSPDRIYNSSNDEIAFINDVIDLKKDTSNIILKIFKENPSQFKILDRRIEPDGRILLTYNQSLPNGLLEILEPAELDKRKTLRITPTNDTAYVWLPELSFDSLKIGVSHENSGDTILIRRNKKDTYNRAVSVVDNLTGNKIRPSSSLILTFSAPMNNYTGAGLSLREDSLQVRNLQVIRDSVDTRKFLIRYPWKTGKEYNLRFDENAFTDTYGNKAKSFNRKFSLNAADNYGSISINVSVPDTTRQYLVQWLGERDDLLRQDEVRKNTVLNYTTYPTAKYKIRVIYDDNKNGRWDTGSVFLKRQPERTYTFEKIISLRPNWDLEENITIPDPE